MKSFALFLFGLAVATIVIGCKNPSSGTDTTGTDTTGTDTTTYTVTYDANGGTGTVPTDSVRYDSGASVTAKAAPTGLVPPTDKRFDGWNTRADGSGTDVAVDATIAMPSGGGLTLYAKWVDITYTVTYSLNGGTGTVPTDDNTYTVGQDVTAAAEPVGLTHPTGKRSVGWNTKADGSGTDVAAGGTIAMISGGLTLYAKWVSTYTVTYHANGGSGTVPTDTNTYTSGASVTAAAEPVGLTHPAGKRFVGWNTRADGSGTDVAAGTGTIAMPSGGLTLYVQWVITYTVTYNLNGGTGTAPTDGNRYVSGEEVRAKAAPAGLTTPADKTFDGWNTRADGSGTDAAAGGTIAMISGGLTLYAKWVDRTYSVTYHANGAGGTVPTDANTYTVGQIVTAKTMGGLTPPAGTTFIGWGTQVIGGTDVPAGGTIAMPSGGLTLYARWRF